MGWALTKVTVLRSAKSQLLGQTTEVPWPCGTEKQTPLKQPVSAGAPAPAPPTLTQQLHTFSEMGSPCSPTQGRETFLISQRR